MTEIKPCPRGHAVADIGFDDEFEAHVIRCMECNWRTWGHTESEAIEGWNTRTPDPSLIAGLREAREALDLGAKVPVADPLILVELRALCERAGYGNVMASASALWRDRLGELAGGEFVSGPCRSTAQAVIANLDTLLSQEGQP